jgi:hypothetical protein
MFLGMPNHPWNEDEQAKQQPRDEEQKFGRPITAN